MEGDVCSAGAGRNVRHLVASLLSDESESAGNDDREVYQHFQPTRDLRSPRELLSAALEHVFLRASTSLSGRMDGSIPQVRLQMLSQPRNSAVDLLFEQSTRTARLLLDLLATGRFSSDFTPTAVLAISGEDAIDLATGGIYGLFGFDKEAKCAFFYVGRAIVFCRRAANHLAIIEGTPTSVKLSGNSLYAVAHSTKRMGGSIFCRALSYFPASSGTLPDPEILSIVWEPAWCALMGTYQRNADVMKLRSTLGLPHLAVHGANQTECFDSIQQRGRVVGQKNRELVLISGSQVKAHIAKACCEVILSRNSSSDLQRREAEASLLQLKKTILDLQVLYKSKMADLLYAGLFVVELRATVTAKNTACRWLAPNFFGHPCSRQTLEKLFGVQIVLDSEAKTSPLFLTARLCVIDRPHSSTDCFSRVTAKEAALVAGVGIEISSNRGAPSQWWRLPPRKGKGKSALLKFILDSMPQETRDLRLHRAENVFSIATPDSANPLVYSYLNGEVPAGSVARRKVYKIITGSMEGRGRHLLSSTFAQRDAIAQGQTNVYFGINPVSKFPLFPLVETDSNSVSLALLRRVGLAFFDSYKNSWTPITKSPFRGCASDLRSILLETVEEWDRLGRPVLVAMDCAAQLASTSLAYVHGPSPDSDEEPSCFCRWQARCRLSRSTRSKVIVPRSDRLRLTIGRGLLDRWVPDGSAGLHIISIKIDGWRKSRADARVWMRLDSPGEGSGIWHEGRYPVNETIWKYIQAHQDDPPRQSQM